MEIPQNPARLLFKILSSAWNENNAALNCAQVWGTTFKTYNPENTDINDNLIQFYGLINQVRKEILSVQTKEDYETEEKESYLRAVKLVSNFLIQDNVISTSKKWNSVKARVSNQTIEQINAAGRFIRDENSRIQSISLDKLEEFKNNIRSLIDDISSCSEDEIDRKIKRTLIKKLLEMQESIINYGLQGSSGLCETGDNVIGKLFRLRDYFFDNILGVEPDKKAEITQKYMGRVLALALSVTGAATGYAAKTYLPKDTLNFFQPILEASSQDKDNNQGDEGGQDNTNTVTVNCNVEKADDPG